MHQALSLFVVIVIAASSSQAKCAAQCERAWADHPPPEHWVVPRRCVQSKWRAIYCSAEKKICREGNGATCLSLTRDECRQLGFRSRETGANVQACCIAQAAPRCRPRMFCKCRQR